MPLPSYVTEENNQFTKLIYPKLELKNLDAGEYQIIAKDC